jgi:hypothetical protein
MLWRLGVARPLHAVTRSLCDTISTPAAAAWHAAAMREVAKLGSSELRGLPRTTQIAPPVRLQPSHARVASTVS